jgi:hypothetical protein
MQVQGDTSRIYALGVFFLFFKSLQIFPCKNPSKIVIIASHMQQIIQIYPCLLKLSRKQDTILKIGDCSTEN